MPSTTLDYAVVVPTIGRPSLDALLASLAQQPVAPREVVVVDDRRDAGDALDPAAFPGARVVCSRGRGPAAARNLGWRATSAPWVVTLDDDVLLPPGWSRALVEDLRQHPDAGAVSGRIVVPLPARRRPTDWERSTAALETAQWATADMAFARRALESVAGFDERFPRAYREDADVAARIAATGRRLERGRRHVLHPVRPADRWVSVRVQRGNADDALMRAVHGRAWRTTTGCGRGRLPWHAGTVAAAVAAALATAAGRPAGARLAVGLWAALTADFARRRIAPGPRTRAEVATMIATSVVIPPVAVGWRAVGTWRHRGARPWQQLPAVGTPGPRAVLVDRDGTLVHDVPYNGEPALVQLVDTAADVRAVHEELQRLVGPFDAVAVCPHGPEDGCRCRKPAPGLVLEAARQLGVRPEETVVVGDIGADVGAAATAGARSILVPTAVTRPEEIAAAPLVAPDLARAVDLVLGPRSEGGR